MARAYFYYQQKIDPEWYVAPVSVPDLSWSKNTSVQSRTKLSTLSVRINTAWYLPTDNVTNLSWSKNTSTQNTVKVPTASASVNTSWYLFTNDVIDLAWSKSTSVQSTLKVSVLSVRVSTSWYLPTKDIIDLSWIQTTGLINKRLSSTLSTQANSSTYMPVTELMDLMWLQLGGKTNPSKAPTKSTVTTSLGNTVPESDYIFWPRASDISRIRAHDKASKQDSSANFISIAAAPNITWLQSGGDFRRRKNVWYSKEINVDWYIDPTIMLGLEWINTSKDIHRKHPVVVSNLRTAALFMVPNVADISWIPRGMDFAKRRVIYSSFILQNVLFPVIIIPDLSWMQTHGTGGYRFGINQGMYGIQFSNFGSTSGDGNFPIQQSPTAGGRIMQVGTQINRKLSISGRINRNLSISTER